ncbi:MAG: hypothetical protein E6J13_14360 [Chloroflexi bacterium]|nr:MAG: hypothetical protein E6J13_14360 [Chloroflexota bacterium]
MLVIAVGAGAVVGFIARPGPTPTPTPSPSPAPTPEPDTGPLVFQQPLSSGCATGEDVFVVSNGGGIGWFDGQRWQLIDSTLRSLVGASCTRDTLLAVGGAGRVLTVDDVAKTISADDIGAYDLNAISVLPDGALVVGEQGLVQRQTAGGWQQFAQGLSEDLFGVVGFSGTSAWAVGSGGVSYRLEAAGWRPFDTGTTAALRTVAGASSTDAIAAGDDGVLLRFDGRWRPLDSGVKSALRASARAGGATYVAGDGGVVLRVTGGDVARVDLGTSCALTGVFARGAEVWFVGSEGLHAGVWRRTGDRIEHWGTC